MDGMTLDNLTTVFGNLQRSQEAQTKTLDTIKGVIEAKTDKINEYLVKMVQSITDMQRSMVSTVTSLGSDINERQVEQISATEKHTQATTKYNDTISKGFKALTSSFLTREGTQVAQPRQKELRPKSEVERQPTKLEKQSYKEQVAIDTKMGLLLKEVQSQKNAKESGGILKFLAPILALVGGFAVLSFAAMKFGPTRQFLQNIQKNGLFNTLKGLMSKFQDKKVTDWLRGLPLIGRFFDIYDAFTSFAKGDWRGGLKHLAFALPFGETIINIIGGKTYGTKEAFLGKGGATNLIKNFSLKNIWKNFKQVMTDFFTPITDIFDKVAIIFKELGGGSLKSMQDGWLDLAGYFPVLSPVAEFLSGLTSDVFNSTMGKEAQASMTQGKFANFGDIIKISLDHVWEGISKFFNKVLTIFMKTGEVLNAIGDLFSGDYSKQAAALNAIDDISPGMGSTLRGMMNAINAFESIDIKAEDDFSTIAQKLMFKARKKTKDYSARTTTVQELNDKAPLAAKDKDNVALQERIANLRRDYDTLAAKEKLKEAQLSLELGMEPVKRLEKERDAEIVAKKKEYNYDTMTEIGKGAVNSMVEDIKKSFKDKIDPIVAHTIDPAKKQIEEANKLIETNTKLKEQQRKDASFFDTNEKEEKKETTQPTESEWQEAVQQRMNSHLSDFMNKAGIRNPYTDLFKYMQPKPLMGEGYSPIQQAIDNASANKDQVDMAKSIITGIEKSSAFSNLGALKEILIATKDTNKFLEKISETSAIAASKEPQNINIAGGGHRPSQEVKSSRRGPRAAFPNAAFGRKP